MYSSADKIVKDINTIQNGEWFKEVASIEYGIGGSIKKIEFHSYLPEEKPEEDKEGENVQNQDSKGYN